MSFLQSGESGFENSSQYSRDDSIFGTKQILRRKKADPGQISFSITPSQVISYPCLYFILSKCQNVQNCMNQSIFCTIRINPHLPEMKSHNAWCQGEDVNFDFFFCVDLISQPPIDFSEGTPTLIFHRRVGNSSQVIGFSTIPLQKQSIVNCNNKNIAYYYRNQSIQITSVDQKRIGTAIVTVALGYPEHQSYLCPIRSQEPTLKSVTIEDEKPTRIRGKPKAKREVSAPSRPKPKPKRRYEYSSDEYEYEYSYEEEPRRPRHHSRKAKAYDWTQEALALGWKPPGALETEWEEIASRNGWSKIMPKTLISRGAQAYTEPIKRNVPVQTELCEEEDDESEDDLLSLVKQLNPGTRKQMQEGASQSVKAPLCIDRCGNFEVKQKPCQLVKFTVCDVPGDAAFEIHNNAIDDLHNIDQLIADLSDSDLDVLRGHPDDLSFSDSVPSSPLFSHSPPKRLEEEIESDSNLLTNEEDSDITDDSAIGDLMANLMEDKEARILLGKH